MRKLVSAVTVVLCLIVAAFLWRGPLAERLLLPAAKRNMTANLVASLPDGLHVVLCGAGSPMPHPKRSGPCAAVIAGKSIFVVDAGTNGARNLLLMNVPTGELAAVLLTHFHSDHIDGLGELGIFRWVAGSNTQPLPVLGPPGVERIVTGFNEAYALDAGYRTAHHGPEFAPPGGAGFTARTFDVPQDGSPVTLWDADEIRISAFAVDHRPATPAVGYRFDYKDRSLLLSGDTKESANLSRQLDGVDLLVHEALAANLVAIMNRAAAETGRKALERITHDILDYHATPAQAARIAAAAGVKALLYYHIVPPLRLPGMEAAFLEGVAEAYSGPAMIGSDGTLVSLPSGTEEVEFADLL